MRREACVRSATRPAHLRSLGIGRTQQVDRRHMSPGSDRSSHPRVPERRVLGRRQGVGRRVRAVEASTRLRLVAIEAGDSVDVLLRVPDTDEGAEGQLELDDQTLGQLAAQQLAREKELFTSSRRERWFTG